MTFGAVFGVTGLGCNSNKMKMEEMNSDKKIKLMTVVHSKTNRKRTKRRNKNELPKYRTHRINEL